MNPILKWAGGKRRLLPELLKHVPKKIECYAEPFVGGGALFFEIQDRCEEAILCDANAELINFYHVVQASPRLLITRMKGYVYDEENYYAVRAIDPKELGVIDRAARFLYLNKTCFNGLWRVNKEGRFNVPFGRYTNPTICDADAIRAACDVLTKATLQPRDFEQSTAFADADFIYCDPPYDIVSKTSSFTKYAKDDFTWADQERLEAWARARVGDGSVVVLSNAKTKRIEKLYSGKIWTTRTVKAARAINSVGSKRGKVDELIIYSRGAKP